MAANCVYFFLALTLLAGCSSESNNSAQGGPIVPGMETEAPQQEGGWESSGGDGVACFANSAEATVARAELLREGFLTPATRAKIQSVVTLDSLENLVEVADDPFTKRGLIHITPQRFMRADPMVKDPDLVALKDSAEIYAKVFRQLTLNVPLFADRLGVMAEKFPLSTWEPSAQVPQVNDSKSQKDLPPECVLVQIANRYTRSEDGRIPETKIVYDQELYRKMPAFEQAVLRMHEYMYAVAKEGGHEDSNFIRRVNAYFFADSIELDKASSLHASITRQVLDTALGDYMRFFLKEDVFKPTPAPANSQGSRYNALISMMVTFRGEMAKCLESGKERAACQDQVILGDLKQSFDGEQAFLFMARFYLDTLSTDYNSEMLTAANLKSPETTPQAIARQLADSCQALSDKPSMMFRDVLDKALLYCLTELNQPVSPLSTRPFVRKIECSASASVGAPAVFRSEGRQSSFKSSFVTEHTDSSAIHSVVDAEFEVIETGAVIEQFDFDYGVKTFTAPQTYRFSLRDANQAEFFKRTLKLYPHLLQNLRVIVIEGDDQQTERTLQAQEAMNYLNSSGSDQSAFSLPRDIALHFPRCTILDTNLPYETSSMEMLSYWQWKTKSTAAKPYLNP